MEGAGRNNISGVIQKLDFSNRGSEKCVSIRINDKHIKSSYVNYANFFNRYEEDLKTAYE